MKDWGKLLVLWIFVALLFGADLVLRVMKKLGADKEHY